MADEFAAAPNRTSESPTKTIESVLLIDESSLRDSPSIDGDTKSDEIEREKTVSPSLEIAEECIESFIHQGLENVANEHGQPASTSSETYARNELEISKPLSDGHNKVNNCLQESISDTIPLHDSEGQGVKEETSNIIMEAKNIINTCLLDAGNVDDRLSINADDNIDNSEKELNEVGKEMDVEENFEKNIKEMPSVDDDSNHQRTSCPKSKMNDSESDIEDTVKSFNKEGHNVATEDDGVYSREGDNFDDTKDGKKDKKKHKHHKKHGKKKKKKHKEKKAEKTKGKDFDSETNTNTISISAKPSSTIRDQSLEQKSPQKRKLASIVACVSSPIVSISSGKDKIGANQSTSPEYKESNKYENSERQSSERSSKSTESIKDEGRLLRQSSSTSKTSETKDQAKEQGESSECDNFTRRSTERSSKSTESIKDEPKGERLHRQSSSTSKASETKDQAEDDNMSYQSDKSVNEKHKKSKKKRRRKSRDEGQSKDSPQSLDRFSKSCSTKSEKRERRKRSESSDREGLEPSRQRSYESSRRSSQSERQKSSSTKSEERERRNRSESSDREDLEPLRQHSFERSRRSSQSKRQKSSSTKSEERERRNRSDSSDREDLEPLRQHSFERSRRSSQSKRQKSSSTKSEERERRNRSDSSDREDLEPLRQHSFERSRRSSQLERQKSRSTRSRSRDSDEQPSSRNRYSRSRLRSRSKSKERSKRRRKRSRSKSSHRRSRSKSTDRISKYQRESSTSMDRQTKEEWLRDQERSKSERERSRSRSVEKRKKRKRDSERSRNKSRDESSRSEVDSSTSELNKESKCGSFSKEHEPLIASPLLQKHNEKTPSCTNRSDKTSDSTDWDQETPRKRALKERSPISVESNAPPTKHALLRSPSRERSSKKCPWTSTEAFNEDRTNLSDNSTVETLASELAREIDKNDKRKAETKVEEHLDKERKVENSGNVVAKEASEGIRKQMEPNEISESGQTSNCSNRQDEKGISNDTPEEVKTIRDEREYSARNKKDESSVSSDTNSCIDKSGFQPEDQHKVTDVDDTIGSDRETDSVTRWSSDQNTTIVKNDPFNQNSVENTNNQFGIHAAPLPPPPPPPHCILTQNQFVDSNLPRGPPVGNIVCPPVVDPYARTFPDSGMLMHHPPIHQQPHNVPGCPVPQNISGPQIQSGNQNAFSPSNTAFTANIVPQGFTLGSNQEPLKDNTSAPSQYIQPSSLLGLPTSASAIPFLGDEGPKISHEKKEEPSNNGEKTGEVDSNHALAYVPSPVDMDMSSPEEDIIDKMNEEFWENERKGTEKDDNSVPHEKGHDTHHEPSMQNVLGEEEDYDPEHFVSYTSPKRKKKKDKTKKHSDSKPKTKVQSLLDKLHRQARVEGEVKIVLKDYYKHREIDKNEYKDILRKAVPQVANSEHSIDPERIRSLVKKYVAKIKGQRLLKPSS